jgi:SAM domain (Sterile alpha motif)
MDIVVWLRSLGLGKYEAAFRENEIDQRVLPNLTVEDLKDLGVSIVGHRRKLRLQGIAEPNSVIAESTRKLLGNLFQLEDRGAHDFKGTQVLSGLGEHYVRLPLKAASTPSTPAD